MRLQRLIVQGFKSFKDRTIIHFDKGITGIIGPNGCGKSNIVDALFWVMGEQSAKHLRGHSMKDVIFSGSDKYSQASYAEVSLVLSNEEKKFIHILDKVVSPDEIQLTRKLYKDGESEYRINDIICRLKDIQEIFMDTGAGAKSYSIIAQGEVNRLVQAKPEERRFMIEEVAGITKFKVKKKESLRKMEKTQENLTKINDLKEEVGKQLKSLEGQSEKAKKAKDLKEKIKRNEVIIKSHEEFKLLNELKDKIVEFEDKVESIEKNSIQKNIIDLSLEEENHKKIEWTQALENAQNSYNQLAKKLVSQEEKLKSLKFLNLQKEKEIELRKNESVTLVDEKKIQEEKWEATNHLIENLENEFDELILENLENDLSEKQSEIDQLKEHLKTEKNRKKSQEAELNNCKFKIDKISNEKESLVKKIEDINEEIEKIEIEQAKVINELNIGEEEFNELKQGVNNQTVEFNKVSVEKNKVQDELKNLENSLKLIGLEQGQIEGQKKTLLELKDQSVIHTDAIKNFLTNERKNHWDLLENLIECENEWVSIFETAIKVIGPLLVSSEKNTFKQFDYKEEWGEVKICAEVDDQEGNDVVNDTDASRFLSLDQIVKINKLQFKEVVEKILSTIFVVDSEDDFFNFKDIPSSAQCILLKNSKKAIVRQYKQWVLVLIGEMKENSSGPIYRNLKLRELEEKLLKLEKESHQLEEKQRKEKNELVHLIQDFQKLDRELQVSKVNLSVKENTLQLMYKQRDIPKNKVQSLNLKKTEYSNLRLINLENEQILHDSFEELSLKDEKLESEIIELENELEDKESINLVLREKIVQYRTELKNFESKKQTLNNQRNDLQDTLARIDKKIGENKKLLQDYTENLEQNNLEIEELNKSNLQQAEFLEEYELKNKILKDQLDELLENTREREKELKNLVQNISKLEKELIVTKNKVDQIINEEIHIQKDLFEKYHIDIREIIASNLQLEPRIIQQLKNCENIYLRVNEFGESEVIAKEPFEFVRKYGKDLEECSTKLKRYRVELTNLGEINWMAVDEFARQKKRFDFLSTEEEQLKSSLVNLQTAIQQIDAKCKVRFMEAFDEVNRRFERVFPILFGGGEACLKIHGSIDDPECGIEILASPPGKKMQSIVLMSGGEKAMTAVALIFSIFLYRPSPFCLLDEVDAPLDDANVGRFSELLKIMGDDSQFIVITHNKKTMELNDVIYGITMQEPGVSKAVSVQLH